MVVRTSENFSVVLEYDDDGICGMNDTNVSCTAHNRREIKIRKKTDIGQESRMSSSHMRDDV